MKAAILGALQRHVQEARKEALQRLASLQEALESEAKSTAGDKHETGRARIHQEMEQVNETLVRCDSRLLELNRWAKSNGSPERVGPGVLVETNGPLVLVGMALGKVVLGEQVVLAISSEAPVAKAWHGTVPGESVRLGEQVFTIRALH